MESAILGVVFDSSVLIAGERLTLTAVQVIEDVVKEVGAVPIILSVLTVAEIGHGIYRASTGELANKAAPAVEERGREDCQSSEHQ